MLFVFFTGLCVGSFLNVCIWRIPQNESIIFPPSHCPKCNNELSWFENIPLLSWICLRGRCRNCSNPISVRYILVELLTGLLFLGVWYRVLDFNLSFYNFIGLLCACLCITVLAVLTAFIDYEHFIIPNKITYPVLLLGLGAAPFFPELWGIGIKNPWTTLGVACASISVCAGLLVVLSSIGKFIFKRDVLGWGDIKYIAAVAAVFGPISTFFILFVASVLGAVSGLLLIALKKKKLRSSIPFGVSLAIASYLWILRGNEIVRWYLNIST
jgi:leader peptidase (prepilin peptidase)/N-methyltransferase